MEKIWDYLRSLLIIIFNPLIRNAGQLINKAKPISLRYVVFDFVKVILSVGMPLIFTLIGALVFTVLPQGKDTMLIVVEDIENGLTRSTVWLFFGIIFWAQASEFASRYAVYVTDNSARSISGDRVAYRKELQNLVSRLFLFFPFLIVGSRLIAQYVQRTEEAKEYPYWILFILLYVALYLIAYLYLPEGEEDYNSQLKRKNEPSHNPLRWIGQSVIRHFDIRTTKAERMWVGRLFGIYNTYVFNLPKKELFDPQSPYQINEANPGVDFPLSGNIHFKENKKIPKEFIWLTYGDSSDNVGKMYEWTYYVPNSFFVNLHKQLYVLAFVSLVSFIIISLLPVSGYDDMGAPALVCIAFGCWLGIYSLLLYIDCAILRYPAIIDPQSSFPKSTFRKIISKVSFRLLLFVLVFTFSYLNNDHPVRTNNSVSTVDHRPTLKEHFSDWQTKFQLHEDSTSHKKHVVYFVCAEGGALRTGAFTALFLARLQDQVMSNYQEDSAAYAEVNRDTTVVSKLKYKLSDHIYAFSGVSGGSVGLSFFNGITYLNSSPQMRSFENEKTPYEEGHVYSNRTKHFFKGDFLSPVIGKMFFSEFLNLLWPQNIPKFNRAIALEESWENRYFSLLSPRSSNNVFALDFNSNYAERFNHLRYPALFINTTEVETGRQCWVTNVSPEGLMEYEERDLFHHKLNQGINYSTAINFSSRFPLFSPGAMLGIGREKYHYVDGGYFENSGASTMLEVLRYLNENDLMKDITPYVLMFRFSDDDGGPRNTNINFINELSEIVNGIYNVRSGHTYKSVYELEAYVERHLDGKFISFSLPASAREVPMNWALSGQAIENLDNSIDYLFTKRKNDIDVIVNSVR